MTILIDVSGRALAFSQDTDLCTSNGTHPACTGPVVGGDVSEATSTVLTMPDLFKLYRAVGKAYRGAGCAWLGNGVTLTLLDSLVDDAGRPILNNQFQTPTPIGDSPGNEGFIFRHPVYEVPLANGQLIFGNIRAGYAVGRRTGVEVRTSDGPGFDAGLIHVLVEEEYDAAIRDAVAIKQMAGLATVA
jgi:HK97 family phage major capsid protein